MSSVYAFGSSHSIGFNHVDWNPTKRYASTCYPKVLADSLNADLQHFGHVGLGVDYVAKQMVSHDFGNLGPDDIAVVQLYGIYGFKTMFEPKVGRTFGAVTQYSSLDSKGFNFKMASTDDVQDFIDYMHHVNTIISRCEQLFDNRFVVFLCQPLKDQNEMFKKVEIFSPTERSIMARFKYYLTHRICLETLRSFALQNNPRFTSDGVHFNESVHAKWAEYLKSKL